ncbi:MAG: tyrosine-type recombinase/integrase [Proteobacteria bacterium]|nr:tyrosine-type recombinase/integrase [Pseudomonadota bacterium]
MAPTDWIINYRRYLKRRNDSRHTVKNYMTSLGQFLRWVDVPIEEVTARIIGHYIEFLMARGLRPKSINCHLERIRQLYHYLIQEEGLELVNPVKKGYGQRMSKPLPRHLTEEELDMLFRACKTPRDRAMFMFMLRCGLRVAEVADLSLGDMDLVRRRLLIHDGKGRKDRIVYLSDDALLALDDYLAVRPTSTTQKVFLVEKGTYRDGPLSIRAIQKRMEYYAKKTQLKISCHHLRHTMATQMLNADAELVTIQDLLGHRWITTTQRYCRISNRKVQRDYYKAMEVVMQRTGHYQSAH